jgi:hypothetical protein|tara:strand:+ start:5212 stop:5499 length:288 start_codon:yes stop_codon:yes gene_type:complete
MSSPYKNTPLELNGALGILSIRPVPAYADDPLYTIEPQYTHRPDLLAHDMYGSNRLWWVFAQRNLDVIEDPIYDMVPGLQIYLPDAKRVKEIIGE